MQMGLGERIWRPTDRCVTSHLAEGYVLGDYEIASIAGEGGMGIVYKARQRSLGRFVALKVIRGEIAREPEYRERFLREARLAASVDHPHVVSVHEVGDQDGRLFLAMQWIDGEDLKRIIEQSGRLSPERAVAITAQLAGALDAVHGVAGLIHRDVKPANVLIRQVGGNDHAYLGDFGVAKPSDPVNQLTKTGWMVGTAGYLSPEQIRGGDPSPRSDLYALGCLFFEALTGRMPFTGLNEMALRWAHAHDSRPLASAALPGLGVRYDGLVSTALAVDPDQRFASGREFADALKAAHHLGPDATAATASVGPIHTPTAVGPPTPISPAPHTSSSGASPHQRYGYVTPSPGYPPPGRSGNPLALVLLGIVALAGIAVGALAAAGVFSHTTAATSPLTGRADRNTAVPSRSQTSRVLTTTVSKTVTVRQAPANSTSVTPPAPTQATATGTWPTATSAWTVVLKSSSTQGDAQQAASRAAAAGLPETGVLLSSDHSSLRAGYWVAFSGVLSHDQASTRAIQARAAGFPDAYTRFVSTG